jgi:renalase
LIPSTGRTASRTVDGVAAETIDDNKSGVSATSGLISPLCLENASRTRDAKKVSMRYIAPMHDELLILGAGVSGLALARRLQQQGRACVVLERSRGVGGRCATRRVDGRGVDHGLPLLHGLSPAFVDEISTLTGCTPITGWPHRVRGVGTPCQPQVFGPGVRLAIREGVSAFPKALARDLKVELQTEVERLELRGDRLLLHAAGATHEAPTVVLTCPVDQALSLLAPLVEHDREVEALCAALRTVFTLPCLTVIAGYDPAQAEMAQPFDLLLPGAPCAIHSLINDSSKRDGAAQVLVIQGRGSFSRERLEEPAERWRDELLAAAAALVGDWARAPLWSQTHRWRHARVYHGSQLGHPVLLRLAGGATLGLCGDAFHAVGGVEGAYLSGLELAERLRAGAATGAREG